MALLGNRNRSLLGGAMGPLAVQQAAQQQFRQYVPPASAGRVIAATGRPVQDNSFGQGLGALGESLGDIAGTVKDYRDRESGLAGLDELAGMPGMTPEILAAAKGMRDPQNALKFAMGQVVAAQKTASDRARADQKTAGDRAYALGIAGTKRKQALADQKSEQAYAKEMANIAAGKPTSAWKNYQAAAKNGFPGSFYDYQMELKKAGSARTTIPNTPPGAAFGRTAAETKDLALKLGVPVQPGFNAYRGFNDPKKVDAARIMARAKQLAHKEKIAPVLAQQTKLMAGLNRFEQLLDSQSTGGVWRNLPVVGAGGTFDLEAKTNPVAQEMQAIISRMVPAMRGGLTGSSSDLDVAMFKSATVGRGATTEANRNIAMGLRTAVQNALEQEAFRDAYFEVYETTIGADRHWREYLEANPVFNHGAKGDKYELNTDRQTWGEYFTKGKRQTPEGQKKVIGNKTLQAFKQATTADERGQIFLRAQNNPVLSSDILDLLDEEGNAEMAAWLQEKGYGN